MTNKQKIAIGSVIGLLAIGLSVSIGALIGGAGSGRSGGGSADGSGGGNGYYSGNGSGGYGTGGQNSNGVSSERDNILPLAKRYIERGEYERAMDLLDSLLITNADDSEALDLMDDVILLRDSDASGTAQRNSDGTNSELQQTLEEMAEANRAADRKSTRLNSSHDT